jgi:predicted GIY-YIG superfamily endonuclease
MGTKRSSKFLVNRNQMPASGEKLHYSVYVILLEPAVLQHRSILRLNPNRDPAKPCVYVGMTGLAVQERFQNHKTGRKGAQVVEKYGIRLMPELYEYLNPMPYEAAAQMEKDLAEDLRAEGYTVAGGT